MDRHLDTGAMLGKSGAMTHRGLTFGIFLAPFHRVGENPTLAIARDMELLEWLDHLGYDEAWIGEHHSAGWELIASPELVIAAAAERTRHIMLGSGVTSLPYHNPLLVAQRFVQLDHMTRGRAMLGCGPGALVSDAYMLGIEPVTQRQRMDEALGVIMTLLRCEEPVTMKTDWFDLREARLHLAPYSDPHFPIAVASTITPFGVQTAGKYGVGVLSLAAGLPGGPEALAGQWRLAEETAAGPGRRSAPRGRQDGHHARGLARHGVQGHRAPHPPERRRHRRPALPRPRVGAAPRDPQELRALRPLRHAALPGLARYRPGLQRLGARQPQGHLRPQRRGRAPRLHRCGPRGAQRLRGAHGGRPRHAGRGRHSAFPRKALSPRLRSRDQGDGMSARRIAIALVALGLAACATALPPAVRVTDISALAGTYSGRLKEVSQLSRST